MTDKSGLSGFLLLLMTTVTLITLTGFQVTSVTAGTRLLGRLGVALIEIDLWLPVHHEELQLLARDKPEGELKIGDLPFEVAVSSALVLEADEILLRSLISEAVGSMLYQKGSDSLVTGEGDGGSLGLNEPIRWLVTMFGSSAHGFWQVALPLALVLFAVLLAAVLSSGGSPLLSVAAGAAVAATLSLLGWLLMQLGESSAGSALDKETFMILGDGFWIGVRNGAAVAVAATTLLLLVRNLSRVNDRQFDLEPAIDSPEEPFV